MSLWSEIKQRRITQIVIGYLTGGWVVLAVIDQVVDREVLPLVVYEVVLTLFLFGILFALIIGWFHGEKGEQKAPPIEIVALTVIGIFGLGASAQVVRSSMAETARESAVGVELRDMAVTYLDDVSSDGSMQAVADGITEGLISSLRAVQELDVASRNAAREVRDLEDPAEIAEVLDVGAVVDGSVDQVGDELRVSIRMHDASGINLMAERYTWPVDQVATVGSELAEEIGVALRELLGEEIRVRAGRDAAPNQAAWLGVARAERYVKDANEAAQAGDAHATIEAFEAAEAALTTAREAAPEWVEPVVLQSQVAYEQFILAGSVEELLEMLSTAVSYADEALDMEPDNAGALEWRGTATYRRYLLQADNESDLERMLASAKSDLERARTLDRSRASVNSTLSHLYYQTDEWTEAILAARDAYRQDAFLDVADGVLWRLYTASYDTNDPAGAEEWCQTGYERFPRDFRFVQCQLWLMTMTSIEPDIERAWELHGELLPLLTERPEYFDALARTVIGGVIGRAGLADSANVVIAGARAARDIDPESELLSIEAAMRSVFGDEEGAMEALDRYVVLNEQHAPGNHWWWTPLEGRADFQRLREEHSH